MTSPDNENGIAQAGFIEQSRNKDLAKDLAGFQEKVLSKLALFSQQNIKRFKDMSGYKDEECLLFGIYEGSFQGIEDVGIGIAEYFQNDNDHHRKVGVANSARLYLGLHTDRETWEAIQQLEAYDWEGTWGFTLEEVKKKAGHIFTEEEVDDMTFPGTASSDNYGTYYFADKEGNFAKVVSIPEELADGRPDLEIEGHHIGSAVSVQVPMLARDFVFYKASLETLNTVLDREMQGSAETVDTPIQDI